MLLLFSGNSMAANSDVQIKCDGTKNTSATSSEKSRENKATEKCAYFWNFIFYVFCFLAGQYINFEIIRKPSSSDSQPEARWKKLISVFALFLFAIQVILYISYVGTALTVEGFTIINASSTVMSPPDNDSIISQEHWKFSTAVTISAIAAIFSYGLMTVFILITANVIQCCSSENDSNEGCCIAYKKALRDGALSPYNDKSSNLLSTKQTCYFFTNYVVVLALFLTSAASSIYYATTVHNHEYCWINIVYFTMIVLQVNSHFCAIQSCFIFSKIIYKVTNMLKNCPEIMDCVIQGKEKPVLEENDTELKRLIYSDDKEKADRGRYYWLVKYDQNFIEQVKPILDVFGLWFIFHWTLYALTTVLLSAFIIQIVIGIIQYNFKSVDSYLPNGEAHITASYVLYVVSFTMVHAYLFLYPCFRAAAIGTARANMINTVFEKRWLDILPLLIQTSFIQYLTSKKFAFQVPLFCVSIPIGFSWVFVSFLVPILGVYLAL